MTVIKQIRAVAGVALASRLRRHASSSLVLQGLVIVLTLLTGVVLARALGPAEYGVWAICTAALAAIATAASLGLPNLVTRRVAEHEARTEWGAARSVVTRSLRLSLLCSVVVALAAITFVFAMHTRESVALVAVTAAAIPVMALTAIWGAALRGLGHGVAAQVFPTLLRPLTLLAGVLAATLILRTPVNALAVMTLNLAAAAAALVGTWWLYRKVSPTGLRAASASEPVPRLWREAVPFLVISVAALLGARIDVFIIGTLLGSSSAGFYDVAYRGAELVMLPLVATTAVLAPEYAKRFAARDQQGLQRLVTQSGRGLVLLSAPVALCLVLWPEFIVRMVFGSAYAASAASMAILAAGYLITLVMGPVHVLLGMTGHSGASAAGALLAAVLGAALSLVLIPRFGIEGAAFSRILAQALTAGSLAWFARRRTGIHTLALASRVAP